MQEAPADKQLTLGQCIEICRSIETSAQQLKVMTEEDVRFVKEEIGKQLGRKKKRVPEKPSNKTQERMCKSCARQHPFAKKNCPTWGASCKNCSKLNHFAACCQKSKKKVLSVDCESDDKGYEYVAEIKVKSMLNLWP